MAETPKPLRNRFPLLGSIMDSSGAVHWLISLAVLIAYFPLLVSSFRTFGDVAVSTAMLPGLVWALLLGPGWAFLGVTLLTVPDYLLFLRIDPNVSTQILPVFLAHLGNAIVAFIIGYGFRFRRLLSRELAVRTAKEAMFQGLFDRTNDAVIISDVNADRTIRDVNSEALRLLGYTRQELVGKPYRDLVAPEEREDLKQRQAQSARGEWLPFYERTYLRKDGQRIVVEINGATIRDAKGQPLHNQTIARDISERKAAQEQLYAQATHDDLTGIYNRAMFVELLKRGMDRTTRNKDKMAVLFIDLDGFKKVNDTYGHATGDLLLKAVTERLQAVLRKTDALGRMGGDEFAIILEALHDRQYAQEVTARVESDLAKPFELEGKQVHIGASVGIAVFPDDTQDPEGLLSFSDNLMYKAKRNKYAKNLGWPMGFYP
jgi:diguanylate cyclase (GGDEF)-like protein/PAS domain S-box-containing protein